jgi:hypothetical protein
MYGFYVLMLKFVIHLLKIIVRKRCKFKCFKFCNNVSLWLEQGGFAFMSRYF